MGSRRRSSTAASEAGRLLSQLGASKGGKASAAALTPEQRQERGRNAVGARWKGRRKPPIDQSAVIARLKGAGEPVVLRIAPGGGGKRRRAAIYALAEKGLLKLIDVGVDSVTVAAY
jgi:hypothetical protein